MENNYQENNYQDNNYQKNPSFYNDKKGGVWKWIIIYLVIGILVYGLVYFAVMMMKGGNVYAPVQYENNNPSSETLINDQEFNSISSELDNVNVDQIDTSLNQNDSDANSF